MPQDMNELSNIFSASIICQCCERHARNRPTEYAAFPRVEDGMKLRYECKCPCRHNARFMCRCDDLVAYAATGQLFDYPHWNSRQAAAG